MGQEIESTHFRQHDFNTFQRRRDQEMQQLAELFQSHAFDDESTFVGIELEAWLLTHDGLPAPDNEPFLKQLNSEKVVAELSRFNFELNVDPQEMSPDGLMAMEGDLLESWQKCHIAADAIQRRAMLIGIMPTLTDAMLCLENLSSQNRYAALNEQVLRLRRGRPIPLDIVGLDELQECHQDVMLEGATTSLQVHLQVPFSQSVATYNASIAASAFSVAIAANAPLLFGKRLWHDTRIPLFEQAVDTGSGLRRVSFGTAHADNSLHEVFLENDHSHPIILPVDLGESTSQLDHVRLHNGTIWRWNRPLIGFNGSNQPHIRIEHRVMSAGPTVSDVIANVAFSIGLISAIAKKYPNIKQFLPFETAQDNFYQAARSGWNAEIRWGNRDPRKMLEVLEVDILPLAEQGLLDLGWDQSQVATRLAPIWGRIRDQQNGATWQLEYIDKYPGDIVGLVKQYLSHQNENLPVHQWPKP